MNETVYEPPSEAVWNAIVKQCQRYQAEEEKQRRIYSVLVAAGFLNEDKYIEAKALVESLP